MREEEGRVGESDEGGESEGGEERRETEIILVSWLTSAMKLYTNIMLHIMHTYIIITPGLQHYCDSHPLQ